MDIRIQKAIDFIERHINENVKVDQLAQDAFLSPKYFQKLFKEATNYTPTKYIERAKIFKCKELLETTDSQVLDISVEMGYLNYETFSRTFKRYYTIAPNDYRAILNAIDFDTKEERKVVLKASSCENIYSTIEKEKENLKPLIKDPKVFIVNKKISANENKGIKVKNKFFIDKYHV